MKKREGFVSNSSSASFIIKFTAKSSCLANKTIRKSDDHVDEYWDKQRVTYSESWSSYFARKNDPSLKPEKEKFTNPPYKTTHLKRSEDVYELTQETSMFNDWYDITCWPFIRAISENRIDGIKLIEILQTEEEYSNCNKLVDFDKNPWNWNYEDEKEAALQTMIDHENEYLKYLDKIKQKLSTEETIELTKAYLNK